MERWECVDIKKTSAQGEEQKSGRVLTLYGRKLGEQKGLETPVVQAVNDEVLYLVLCLILANALNTPPGEYGRID
jgi:hypothetical protein